MSPWIDGARPGMIPCHLFHGWHRQRGYQCCPHECGATLSDYETAGDIRDRNTVIRFGLWSAAFLTVAMWGFGAWMRLG